MGPKSMRTRQTLETGLLYLLVAVTLVVFAFPIYWLVTTSLKTGAETAVYPPKLIPSSLEWRNYVEVFRGEDAQQAFVNSVAVSLMATFLTVVVGSLAAYAIAKTYLSVRVRRAMLLWFLVTRIFPPITTAIPYYVLIRRVGLTDTYTGLVLAYVSYGLPFVIWLMLGFFQDLPKELEQAAVVDGCTFWQRFVKIELPLTLPGVAVCAIFAFIFAWNEFLYASIITSFQAKTLPVVIAGYISDKYLRWGEMSALGSLMLVPLIVFVMGAQRYLVRGLTFGAVKE